MNQLGQPGQLSRWPQTRHQVLLAPIPAVDAEPGMWPSLAQSQSREGFLPMLRVFGGKLVLWQRRPLHLLPAAQLGQRT